ncbi:unnamed protein product [Arctia plantaginis]|uniref:Uncharacterized protein n=1 Tax=Arctia plantaginis TaxID=874455 RepID=A0A8S1BP49_ARCPL|nr:unnamed protein product [Arctia plantaginis]
MRDNTEGSLEERVAAFKSDPDKLRQANEFVEQVIQHAKKEVEVIQKAKEGNKFESQDQGPGSSNRFAKHGYAAHIFPKDCNILGEDDIY